ncbi:hypothetical protein OH77DRAFT_1525919 [Trametes cingulata]|nr:hypothetical protein OH77DRAFT_1525919 [Trametes cingulata]
MLFQAPCLPVLVPMLASVFNVHTITGIRRVQSPASFVSPKIVEITASLAPPQLQLDFDTDEPLIPPSILPQAGKRTPPKRNVSLPNSGRAAMEGNASPARLGS